MILIEDANEEKYHINPKQVIYVKERDHMGKKMWKIMMSNGEALMTSNEHGALCIIASIKSKRKIH
jgi:hypothetical protein